MIKKITLFMFFFFAPILGISLAFILFNPFDVLHEKSAVMQIESTIMHTDQVNRSLAETEDVTLLTKNTVQSILTWVNEEKRRVEVQSNQINTLLEESKSNLRKSDVVLEQILSNLLGEPIHTHKGKNSTIKVYSLVEAGYKGYMAKVRVHNSDALKLVLANDKVVSSGETPSHAAKRKGAILAVNAGGFWRTADGKMAPLGITVVNGKIKTFYDHPTLSFVGFNTQGHLVGGKIKTQKELKSLNVLQGSSFVPTLLQDGKKTKIPSEWANTKHPRTIVGNFSNGELLFIVVDGRQEGWSTGVTLEELQDKLLSFKIKDAFNLDGGGSSAFYYNGKILNKPSDGKQRPVTSNIVIMP